jgi:hypothetical protein
MGRTHLEGECSKKRRKREGAETYFNRQEAYKEEKQEEGNDLLRHVELGPWVAPTIGHRTREGGASGMNFSLCVWLDLLSLSSPLLMRVIGDGCGALN